MHIMSPLEAETFMPTASSPVFFHTRAQTYVHMYIYLYIYIYTSIYIYIYTHTHAHHLPTAEREDMAQLARPPPTPPPHSRKEAQTRQKLLRNAHSAFLSSGGLSIVCCCKVGTQCMYCKMLQIAAF